MDDTALVEALRNVPRPDVAARCEKESHRIVHLCRLLPVGFYGEKRAPQKRPLAAAGQRRAVKLPPLASKAVRATVKKRVVGTDELVVVQGHHHRHPGALQHGNDRRCDVMIDVVQVGNVGS